MLKRLSHITFLLLGLLTVQCKTSSSNLQSFEQSESIRIDQYFVGVPVDKIQKGQKELSSYHVHGLIDMESKQFNLKIDPLNTADENIESVKIEDGQFKAFEREDIRTLNGDVIKGEKGWLASSDTNRTPYMIGFDPATKRVTLVRIGEGNGEVSFDRFSYAKGKPGDLRFAELSLRSPEYPNLFYQLFMVVDTSKDAIEVVGDAVYNYSAIMRDGTYYKGGDPLLVLTIDGHFYSPEVKEHRFIIQSGDLKSNYVWILDENFETKAFVVKEKGEEPIEREIISSKLFVLSEPEYYAP